MPGPGFGILLEDDEVLAVNKPAGVATQAPPQFDSLEARIKIYLAGETGDTGAVYLGIPHRLDRSVTGAIIFAKTRRAARKLSRQFERRRVTKRYWACVERIVQPLEGTWTDTLRKVHGKPLTEVVDFAHPEGQEAILRYRTLGYHSAGAWLEIELETGRTHQIRIQASSRGYPVVGDVDYGSRVAYGPHEEDHRLRPIALHARTLAFFHPATRQEITLEAPVSESWNALSPTPRE